MQYFAAYLTLLVAFAVAAVVLVAAAAVVVEFVKMIADLVLLPAVLFVVAIAEVAECAGTFW